MRGKMRLAPALVLLAGCAAAPSSRPSAACTPAAVQDTTRLMADLRVLAADSMEGRLVGTEGSARARRFLSHALQEAGLTAFPGGLERPFTFTGRDGVERRGVNLVGFVAGSAVPDRYIVVTAHYDHVGVRNGEIYNGADDNASGTAALLAMVRHFRCRAPSHSIIFAALDAEEGGLNGARALVANPPVARQTLALNINLDMVGRNDRNELYAAGAYHSPSLRPHLLRVAEGAPVTLRLGHDSPELGNDDWTLQSDHGAFHQAGIPFVYFGVEDHPDYHRPTDDADRIQPAFFAGAVTTVIRAVEELDRNLGEIAAAAVAR